MVPELVKRTGLLESQKSNFRVMNDVGKYTIKRPRERFSDIDKFNENLQENRVFRILKENNSIEGYEVREPMVLGERPL